MLLQSKPVSQLIPILGVFVASAFRMIPSINRVMNSLQTIAFAQSVIDVLVEQFDVIKSHLLKSDKKLKIKEALEKTDVDYKILDALADAKRGKVRDSMISNPTTPSFIFIILPLSLV